jgi:hypothetical protein
VTTVKIILYISRTVYLLVKLVLHKVYITYSSEIGVPLPSRMTTDSDDRGRRVVNHSLLSMNTVI